MSELDDRVLQALAFYRKLIERGRHTPSAAVRAALRGVLAVIDVAAMPGAPDEESN